MQMSLGPPGPRRQRLQHRPQLRLPLWRPLWRPPRQLPLRACSPASLRRGAFWSCLPPWGMMRATLMPWLPRG